MPIRHFNTLITDVDRSLDGAPAEAVPAILRRLPIDLFATLLWHSENLARFRNLHRLLPKMPSPAIQARFAGTSGDLLLPKVCSFMRDFEWILEHFLAPTVRNPILLDYGFGWGRLTRFLARFSTPDHIFGVDPLPEMVQLAKESGLPGTFERIGYNPDSLPFDTRFDIVLLFSVFTHLPWWLVSRILSMLHQNLSPGGLVVFTTRPRSWWTYCPDWHPDFNSQSCLAEHDAKGTSFTPLPSTVSKDPGAWLYGDVSFSDEFLVQNLVDWDIVYRSYCANDALQITYVIRKR